MAIWLFILLCDMPWQKEILWDMGFDLIFVFTSEVWAIDYKVRKTSNLDEHSIPTSF